MFKRFFVATATAALSAAVIIVSSCSAAQAQITSTFTYTGPTISIPGSDTTGNANPYPATIDVSGLPSDFFITNLTVTLNGLTHGFPDDLDILLVGPGSNPAKVLLMSDAGGGGNLNNANLTFSDAAVNSLPDEAPITPGTFKPTNHVGSQPEPDTFSSPAPAGPYSTSLSSFNGQIANGTYSLYIVDDFSGDAGSLTSFSLTLTAVPEPGTFALLASAVVPGIAIARRRRRKS